MTRYILLRLAYLVLAVWALVTLLFFLIRLSGDPIALLVGFDTTPERIAETRRQYGVDLPVHEQYVRFVQSAVALDFGRSFRYQRDALSVVWERVPATVELGLAALLLTAVVAFPAGIVGAVRRGRLSGFLVMVGALVGQSVPIFWLAIMLILLFSVHLRLLPSFGRGGPEHLILPAVTLSSFLIARQARLIRSGMIEVLGQDYIRTARAKGLGELVIIGRHGLRNMMLPIVAVLGVDVSFLIGGSVITETVFAWPGMGHLMVSSVLGRDYPVVQAAAFVIGVGVVLINLLVDMTYRLLDPRISFDT
ncbi:MAG: ABC transporter permease [Chloroflexi bacterium]|nr:ABC transporter permease [Chloroflexota bacterium]